MKKYDIKNYRDLIQKSSQNTEWYWDAVNEDLDFKWFKKYTKVFDSSDGIPNTKWFVNGKCNIIANVIDKHAKNQPQKIAYIFESVSGLRKISYRELNFEVNALACALKESGIKKGDVVAIYLPMIPEVFFSIFACSKIGAVHTTIFSGYSSQALHSRLLDSNATMLITCDKICRRSISINLKREWIRAVENSKVSNIITVRGDKETKHDDINIVEYNDFVKNAKEASKHCETEVMDSEDPLFILYTSGTTGRPKGTIQTHGGFAIVALQQTAYLIDMGPDDILFWYADVGWITGQTWVVYGSPMIGGTALVYEDAIDYPKLDTWCSLIDNHKVSIFGASPTAIRQFMKNKTPISKYKFSSLRILATTGESINKEAWNWYFEKIGKRRCPLINLSGGTEIGGAIVSVLPVMQISSCTVGCPVPGFDVDIFDETGRHTNEGALVIKKPWPSMSRGIVNDQGRFIETYWSKFKDVWYHGDIVFMDSYGLWYILGRMDDLIKVSGHRIGTAEIEEALASHPAVAEAVAIGIADEVKGEAIIGCVVLKDKYLTPSSSSSSFTYDNNLKSEIMKTVEDAIGKFARPKEIKFLKDLPKTRTGKLVRRLVRMKMLSNSCKITEQDLSTIENPTALEDIY